MSRMPIALSWSSGKDSAWALKRLRERNDVEVVALLTTYSGAERRVPIQYTRIELVLAQARLTGLPIITAPLPNPCSNVAYESAINLALLEAQTAHEIQGVAFADIHLSDIRGYREQLLEQMGLKALFPLWGEQPLALAKEQIAGGSQAWVTAVDTTRLPSSFVGRAFNEQFLLDLPAHVDPCGEFGEFHTLVWDSPVFRKPLRLVRGQSLVQGNFVYQDFLPHVEEIDLTGDLAPAEDSAQSVVQGDPSATAVMERPAVVRPSRIDLPSLGVVHVAE
ncbi:MAG: hypothetical protein GEEBNDBF_02377 [bacterium]|nr:hypothetical protein [bacterium]